MDFRFVIRKLLSVMAYLILFQINYLILYPDQRDKKLNQNSIHFSDLLQKSPPQRHLIDFPDTGFINGICPLNLHGYCLTRQYP